MGTDICSILMGKASNLLSLGYFKFFCRTGVRHRTSDIRISNRSGYTLRQIKRKLTSNLSKSRCQSTNLFRAIRH